MSVSIPYLLGIIKACKQISLQDLGILLNINFEDIERMITPLLEEKNIEMNGDVVKFLSHKKAHPLIQLSDAILLGFLKLHRICNLDDLSAEFRLNQSTVLVSVARLNLQPSIDIVIHYESNSGGMIIYLELKQSNFKLDLIVRQSPANTELIEIIDKNYLYEEPGINTFQLLIGFMKFLREYDWKSSQFAHLINCNHTLLSKIYEMKHIIEIMCLFSLDPNIVMTMHENKYIEFQFKQSPQTQLESLGNFDPSIVNSIISVLSSVRMLALLDLQRRFGESEEVLPVLLSLSYFGYVSAILGEDGTLNIQSVTGLNQQMDLLTSDEKIILGYLMTAKKPNAYELGRVLQLNKNEVKSHLERFLFFKKYNGQIARNNDILLAQSIKIPLITKIENLDIIQQTVFGALIWQKIIKLELISNQLKVPLNEIMRIVYELVGNGLLEVQVDKSNIEVTSVSEYKVTTDDFMFEQVFSFIDQNNLRIKLNTIKQGLELSDNEFNALRFRFLANYYPLISEVLDQSIVLTQIPSKFRTIECMYCSNKIKRNVSTCESCRKEVEYCTVCREIMKSNDEVASCPSCHRFSHQSHILQWLEIRNVCPACKVNLVANQLVEVKI